MFEKMDIEKEAQRIITQAAGDPIFLFGAPIGTGQQKNQSPLVKSTCTSCGRAVESTELKEKVKSLLKPPYVAMYCQDCMEMALIAASGNFDIEIGRFG